MKFTADLITHCQFCFASISAQPGTDPGYQQPQPSYSPPPPGYQQPVFGAVPQPPPKKDVIDETKSKINKGFKAFNNFIN